MIQYIKDIPFVDRSILKSRGVNNTFSILLFLHDELIILLRITSNLLFYVKICISINIYDLDFDDAFIKLSN